MAYRYATWLAKALRDAGCKVVEHPGWQTRGLLEADGPFDVRAVVWHHDATGKGPSPWSPGYIESNELAQLWVARDGTWHVLAAGRMAHAGVVRQGAPNNYTSVGVETDHTVGEKWPPAQLAGLRLGTAAILKHIDVNARSGLHFHKSICFPKGRKIDPAGLGLMGERRRVRRLIRGVKKSPPPKTPAASVTTPAGPGQHKPRSAPKIHMNNLRPGQRNGDVKLYQLTLRSYLSNHGLLGHLNPSGATGYFGTETKAMTAAAYRHLNWLQGNIAVPGPKLLDKLGFRVK